MSPQAAGESLLELKPESTDIGLLVLRVVLGFTSGLDSSGIHGEVMVY